MSALVKGRCEPAVYRGAPVREISALNSTHPSSARDTLAPLEDRVGIEDDTIEFRWTFTGANTGPGGTGNRVRVSGFEEWSIDADGLIAESQGHFDQTEYERQLEHGLDRSG